MSESAQTHIVQTTRLDHRHEHKGAGPLKGATPPKGGCCGAPDHFCRRRLKLLPSPPPVAEVSQILTASSTESQVDLSCSGLYYTPLDNGEVRDRDPQCVQWNPYNMVDTIGTEESNEVSLFRGFNKNCFCVKECVLVEDRCPYFMDVLIREGSHSNKVIIVTQVEWERGDVTVTGARSVFDRDGYEFSFTSTVTIDLDTCTNTETLKCTLNYGENQNVEITTSICGKKWDGVSTKTKQKKTFTIQTKKH